jgi:hypothetical protein
VNAPRIALLFALALGAAASADAQRPGRPGPGRGQQGRPDQRRNELEDEVRRNFARAVRERVGLNDEQMQKLGPLTRKFEDQRRQIQVDERDARTKLQALVLIGSDSDSARIRGFLAQLSDMRRRRMQVDDAEQKELAAIMTPLQLAKFLGFQEQVRRRLEQARPFPGGPPDDMPGSGRRPGGPPGDDQETFAVRIRVTPLSTVIYVDDQNVGTGTAVPTLTTGIHRLRFAGVGCIEQEELLQVTRAAMKPVIRTMTCQ